ncbi:unnamed protein product [Onchocerca ochengi]|uniref:tRNA:m(4)X modification enzyme TRM13 n=1 Tax=Onchocerca ochengi TaxID=42157 RepID=A0A182E7A8_ONCOC|nr:unnamed protein product [Onchocerca ochengi]VDK70966.1 unnamed protein product [Onchocerca ochengi]
MLVKNGQKYCGEHAICDELNEDRVVCPNDPKHTVNKSQLQKHLSSRCNSRLPEERWIVENFNLIGSPNEAEPWYHPTDKELLRMGKIVERIYDQIANDIADSFLKNNYVENYAADHSKLDKKHIWQISSIIEHLSVNDLLNNNKCWCLIDFGAGKAQLSYWMAKIAPKCRFLLVEKMGSRNKFDNKIHKEVDKIFLERLRCSVEHLDLSKIDLIQNANNVAAVCKHFCGSATDFGIRCLMNGVKNNLNICGFALAPCCHHRITYREYIGHAFLESHGICSSNEFAALRHISTWAVCGFLSQENFGGDVSVSSHSQELKNADQQKTVLEFVSLNSAEKELLGQKAKAVLEFGRIMELRKFGYDVSLCSGLNSVPGPETSEEQKKRFEIECEFVQALANPHYLNFLAQRGYFKEPFFINYLKYLLYWKRPEYARALKYPQCLHFLEAVQSSAFREAVTCTANAKFIEEQQLLQWQYYTRKRQRLHMYTTEHDDDEQEWRQQPSQRQKERELKFVEALEGTCKRMLQYKLHKEKSDISRFAKEESSTMKALNELRSKGVKVELGMPYEMWDSPSVEIVTLKQNCETLLEHYEDDLEQWYHIQDRPLLEEYLCKKRILKRTERGCMDTANNLEL